VASEALFVALPALGATHAALLLSHRFVASKTTLFFHTAEAFCDISPVVQPRIVLL
jgi:hypothetical protein